LYVVGEASFVLGMEFGLHLRGLFLPYYTGFKLVPK